MGNRDGRDDEGFGTVLQSLKRDGALVLVAGVACDVVLDDFGARLLGEPGADRLRVVGALDRVPLSRVVARLARAGDDDAHVVTTAAHRSTAAGGPATTRDHPTVTAVSDEAAFVERFPGIVEDLVEERGGVEPAELRVGVDSLRALGEAGVDEGTLVATLRDLLKDHCGLGHVVLPVERDAPTVRTLHDRVDVVVELRTRSGTPEHRWLLADHGRATDWLPYRFVGP